MSLNRNTYIAIMGIAISLSVFAAISNTNLSFALKYPFKAPLDGQSEVPPVETAASGEAEFREPANGTMKYRINITGISENTGAHIHAGAVGENGDVIVDLKTPGSFKEADPIYGLILRGNITDATLSGAMEGKTLADLVAAIEAGETYVNIHTANHTDGEIRGQLANVAKTNATEEVGFSTLTE